jgi:hypothetical protein
MLHGWVLYLYCSPEWVSPVPWDIAESGGYGRWLEMPCLLGVAVSECVGVCHLALLV